MNVCVICRLYTQQQDLAILIPSCLCGKCTNQDTCPLNDGYIHGNLVLTTRTRGDKKNAKSKK